MVKSALLRVSFQQSPLYFNAMRMKKKNLTILFLIIFLFIIFSVGCSSAKKISSEKAGTELWAENCCRCHNAPPPSAFDNEEWEVIGLHMRMRAHLTEEETKKIVEFLQSEK